jgi:multidrug efflux pump subunit AcrA (membrane-fusion protein)
MSALAFSDGAARAASMLVRTPRALRTLGRLLVVSCALFVGALGFAPWQQSVDGRGRVVAFAPVERQQELDAPIEGRVSRWLVREGSRVTKGELLLELTDNDPSILLRLGEEREAVMARAAAAISRINAITARQRSLESSQAAALRAARSRLDMAAQRTAAAQHALEAAEAGEHTAKLNLERQARLLEQGLTSQRTLELAQLEAIRLGTEVARGRATLQAALGEESALEADRARVEHDLGAALEDARATEAAALAEQANVAAELARLEVRLARQETMELRAPMDGTVLRVQSGQGNAFVKAGEALLTLVPDTTERAVELWVDGNDLPLLSEGRPVRLQFEGWPAVQFTGWPSVAVGTFGGTVAVIDSSDDGAGRFRVLVRPDGGDPWPSGASLRQGVRANGWVLLDSVRLGYELWRRFNGFPPTVQPGPASGAAKGKG